MHDRPRRSRPTGRRRLAALAALALLGTSCSDGATDPADGAASVPAGEDAPTPSTAPEQPDPAVDGAPALELLATARGDGVDEVTLALTELAALVGPLPGARPVPVDGSVGVSGTGAVESLVAAWDELTEEQRDAVTAVLAPWAEAVEAGTTLAADARAGAWGASTTLVGARAAPTAGIAPSDRTATELTGAANAVFAALGGERPTVILAVVSSAALDGGADAETNLGALTLASLVWSVLPFTGPAAGTDCSVVLGPRVQGLPEAQRLALFVHEMFHCWSIVNSPTFDAHIATPDWYQEGVASWLGETSQGGTGYGDAWWDRWFRPEAMPLFVTSYEAIGFWSAVDRRSGGLLGSIPGLHSVAVTGDDAALLAAVHELVGPDGVSGLAASRAQDAARGPAWTLRGPGVGARAVTPAVFPLRADAVREVDARPGELVLRGFARPEPGDEPLVVAVTGAADWRAAWDDGTGTSSAAGGGAGWCTTTPCTCPDGTEVVGFDDLGPAAEELYVAVAGAPTGTTAATVTVESPCEDEPPPDEPGTQPPTLVGTWLATPGAIDAMFARLDTDGLPGISYAGGQVRLDLGADGTATLTYVDVTLDAAGIPIGVRGGGNLSWGVRDTTMTFRNRSDLALTFDVLGEPITFDDAVVPSGTTEAVWGFTGDDELRIAPTTTGVFLPTTWRRAGS